ncbi:thymidylate kinase-domain-containing protein [Phlebopus sp. FC_14]|nr:thymidylate kinase-domain-containing protein [Phlebopus sp. FC_14]
MASRTRGAFIVIEGLDRAGKSTQASTLLTRLQSQSSAVLIKFPDRTTAIGKMIDAYLRSEVELDDRTIHLLFSANRWELASTIRTHLSAGTTVIADRYAFSGIAFSARKGLPYEWCRAPDIGLPSPDITLFLDISPQDARERGGYGEERYEKEPVQRGVKTVFERIGKEMSQNGWGKWVVIDAGKDRERVAGDVWTAVQETQRTLRGTTEPVKRLWETRANESIGSEGGISI